MSHGNYLFTPYHKSLWKKNYNTTRETEAQRSLGRHGARTKLNTHSGACALNYNPLPPSWVHKIHGFHWICGSGTLFSQSHFKNLMKVL